METDKMVERVSTSELFEFCLAALKREGMNEDDACWCAQSLVQTDGTGVFSHGTKNLYNYIKKKRVGGVSFTARPEVVKEGEVFAVIDGHNAMGMVSSCKAVEMACEKANQYGVAFVCVRNSCHFGAAGFYSNLIAGKGMIGITMSNVDPFMNIPGARGRIIGNNPISFSAPITDERPLNLDIACSTVASLKVAQAKNEHKSIPNTWIVDDDGKPTTDLGCYPDSYALQPMGSHKGYGLAVMVDLMTSVIASGDFSSSGKIHSWCLEFESSNNVCHSFLVIDPTKFMQGEKIESRVKDMVVTLRKKPKAVGSPRIYTPGEIGWDQYKDAEANGIALPSDVFATLRELADDIGIKFPVTTKG